MTRHPPAAWLALPVAALVLGWLAATAWFSLAPLHYTGMLEGVVSLVSGDATKLCLEPDGGGQLRCGIVYGPTGARSPTAGERLTVAVGWIRGSAGLETEIFVILGAAE